VVAHRCLPGDNLSLKRELSNKEFYKAGLEVDVDDRSLVSVIGTSCEIDSGDIYARPASLLTSLVCTSEREDF